MKVITIPSVFIGSVAAMTLEQVIKKLQDTKWLYATENSSGSEGFHYHIGAFIQRSQCFTVTISDSRKGVLESQFVSVHDSNCLCPCSHDIRVQNIAGYTKLISTNALGEEYHCTFDGATEWALVWKHHYDRSVCRQGKRNPVIWWKPEMQRFWSHMMTNGWTTGFDNKFSCGMPIILTKGGFVEYWKFKDLNPTFIKKFAALEGSRYDKGSFRVFLGQLPRNKNTVYLQGITRTDPQRFGKLVGTSHFLALRRIEDFL